MPTLPHRLLRGVTAAAASVAALSLCLTGCAANTAPTSPGAANSASPNGTDDGTKLTMWTRAATKDASQALVDAYNSSHKNQVTLTIVPNDNYQAKVGTAAGAGSLPDMFASDVVYLPNYTSKGLFADLTSRIAGLSYGAKLNKAQIDAGTYNGKKFVMPYVVDASVMFYNKDLFTKAGLDPDAPPTTLKEFGAAAKKISALGGGVSGTYFGGNCPGCMAFTLWPSIWAADAEVMDSTGKKATFDTDAAKQVFAFYRSLVADGSVGAGTKAENGATWVAPFPAGKVGLMPMPGSLIGTMPASTGVSAIPGPNGGQSTFVGGDAIGIASSSKHQDAAWNYLAWSETEAAQVDVLAKTGNLVTQSDYSDNQYSAKDPRVVAINKIVALGKTPLALNYGAAYNDPNGPWLTLFRNQVFGDASKLDADNTAITSVLAR